MIMDLKLEQLTVHSRDISCRYVTVRAGETLSYSIKPQRNSIIYGLYRQPHGTKPNLSQPRTAGRGVSSAQSSSIFEERIRQAQLELVSERRKLMGGKVFKGSLAVEHEGMYCLVFDNTFSKQKSKLVTFILQVHSNSKDVLTKSENLLDDEDAVPLAAEEQLSGVLLKKRRKKLQGWARRWFVLDFETNTLNYYYNEASSVLRGAIPLSVAVFSATSETFEINIDSGAEVWNLRARSEGSFALWKNSLAQARDSELSRIRHSRPTITVGNVDDNLKRHSKADENLAKIDRKLWSRVELVLLELNQVHEGLREAIVSRSSPDNELLDDKRSGASTGHLQPIDSSRSDNGMPSSPKKSFWLKRRPSEISGAPSVLDEVSTKPCTAQKTTLVGLESRLRLAVQNLNNILRERSFSLSKTTGAMDRIAELERNSNPRTSIDSVRTMDEIWCDALSEPEDLGFLVAHQDSIEPENLDLYGDGDSSDDGSYSESYGLDPIVLTPGSEATPFTTELDPLPCLATQRVDRRINIPKLADQPPSALKLMTSRVGSDVSSLSAPAATNEPLSLLQRVAEDLEYAELLEQACFSSKSDGSRILRIAAFAMSTFSSYRHKERAKRKPFNPMLGETYELVREDKLYRFVAEKVQHRPLVGIAAYAEHSQWTYSQYQATSQKFYGKSMLLSTEGTTTIRLNTADRDTYVWEKPDLYLKNITWGEKFLEPCGEIIVRNTTSGEVCHHEQ